MAAGPGPVDPEALANLHKRRQDVLRETSEAWAGKRSSDGEATDAPRKGS